MENILKLKQLKKTMPEPSTKECFNSICKIIWVLDKNGPIKIDDLTRLEMYSLYKIATIGKNTSEKPSLFYPIERMKWQAWKNKENMSKKEAMEQYCKKFTEILINVYKDGAADKYKDYPVDFMENIHKKDILILMIKYINSDQVSEQDKINMMNIFNEKLIKNTHDLIDEF